MIKGDRVEDSRMWCTIAKFEADAARQNLLLSCFSGLLMSKFAFALRASSRKAVTRGWKTPMSEIRERAWSIKPSITWRCLSPPCESNDKDLRKQR